MKKNGSALNFVVTENGTEVITTNQAIKRLRKELYRKAKNNLQVIKNSIHFVLVSELEKVAGTDFGNYINKSFGRIQKDGINGVNNLKTLVKTVASERGITEPCIAYIEVSGKRLLVVDKDSILFLNAEVNYGRDFEYDCYDEKIWGERASMCSCTDKELEEYECDYKLTTTVLLKTSCSCISGHFNEEGCRECELYEQIVNSEHEGKEVIYIKAV